MAAQGAEDGGVAGPAASEPDQSMATTISSRPPTASGTHCANIAQEQTPALFNSRSTCFTACLVSNPRACANAWPIIDTAGVAPVITPSEPLASDAIRIA